MSEKPIVHYRLSGISVPIVVGKGAFIFPVNHPHCSNTTIAHTSEVINYDPETGIFETRNTIYKPLQENS